MARLKDTKGLKFYEASHRYKLDGEWVPGVTTILGVLNKPGLTKWAATAVAEYVADHQEAVEHLYEAGRLPMVSMLKETPWQQRDTKAERGTKFHDYIARILGGEEPDVPQSQIPLVENGIAFLEQYDVQPVLIEAPVGSRKHRYAGTLDLIADSKLGRIALDWKSGKRVYNSVAFQIAAYCFADFEGIDGDERPLPDVEAAYGLQVSEDGYSLVPLKFGPDVFDEFLTIRAAYDINKRCEGDWRTPGSGYAGIPVKSTPW